MGALGAPCEGMKRKLPEAGRSSKPGTRWTRSERSRRPRRSRRRATSGPRRRGWSDVAAADARADPRPRRDRRDQSQLPSRGSRFLLVRCRLRLELVSQGLQSLLLLLVRYPLGSQLPWGGFVSQLLPSPLRQVMACLRLLQLSSQGSQLLLAPRCRLCLELALQGSWSLLHLMGLVVQLQRAPLRQLVIRLRRFQLLSRS